ncbi:hypothetical protein BKA80DRAFT_263164 [Phyllosticta citrichinensis]
MPRMWSSLLLASLYFFVRSPIVLSSSLISSLPVRRLTNNLTLSLVRRVSMRSSTCSGLSDLNIPFMVSLFLLFVSSDGYLTSFRDFRAVFVSSLCRSACFEYRMMKPQILRYEQRRRKSYCFKRGSKAWHFSSCSSRSFICSK